MINHGIWAYSISSKPSAAVIFLGGYWLTAPRRLCQKKDLDQSGCNYCQPNEACCTVSWWNHQINGNFRIQLMDVRKRTICLAIFGGYIPWNLALKNKPYIWNRYLPWIGSWNGHWPNKYNIWGSRFGFPLWVPTLDTDPVIILKSFDGDVWCWHIHDYTRAEVTGMMQLFLSNGHVVAHCVAPDPWKFAWFGKLEWKAILWMSLTSISGMQRARLIQSAVWNHNEKTT